MLALLAAIAALHLPSADQPCAATWGGKLQLVTLPLTGAGLAAIPAAPPTNPVGQLDFSQAAQSGLQTLIR